MTYQFHKEAIAALLDNDTEAFEVAVGAAIRERAAEAINLLKVQMAAELTTNKEEE